MEEVLKALKSLNECINPPSALLMEKITKKLPLLDMLLNNKLNENSQKTDSDKVDYYLKLMIERNLLPDATSLEEKKDDKMSTEVRKEGNLLFASNAPKYLEALRAYNKSLCFATSKDNQCLALTNRSAVFFRMEMYKECLESIALAREVGLIESVREKVEVRATMCKKELKKMRQKESFVPKIGMPVNEKIPFLAKCLELGENEQYGRYVVTDKDIPAGTIIAIKEPFCKIILNEDKYLRCTNCFAELTHLLMPCDNCTQAMFCSKECKEKAHKDFHVIECPISGSLYKTFDTNYLLIFRVTIKAFFAFPDTATMAVALEKIDREQKNVFSYDWSQKLSQEELYAPIRTLKARASDDVNKGVYVGACLAFNLLKHSCPMFSQRYLPSNASCNADNLLKDIFCRNYHTVALNSFSYGSLSMTEDPTDGFGTGLCSFYSLINHSCASNVAPFVIGDTYGVIATENISKGSQLFTNYGVHHIAGDRESRRKELSRRYTFHCQCLACVKDFPMMVSLPVPGNMPDLPFSAMFATTTRQRFSFDFIKKGLRLISDYIRKNSAFYPCLQLYQAQQELLFCLQVLCGVPLKVRETIIEEQSNF